VLGDISQAPRALQRLPPAQRRRARVGHPRRYVGAVGGEKEPLP
jgi:hypothetical protein